MINNFEHLNDTVIGVNRMSEMIQDIDGYYPITLCRFGVLNTQNKFVGKLSEEAILRSKSVVQKSPFVTQPSANGNLLRESFPNSFDNLVGKIKDFEVVEKNNIQTFTTKIKFCGPFGYLAEKAIKEYPNSSLLFSATYANDFTGDILKILKFNYLGYILTN
ncbi:hypothetical protein [Flavobacterium sp.]|jgi:hypothetical protein|uniref:hypothetical protein n=1 Tax=Flavobacterium sp. TaxID=239 RepID=UPI0037BF1F0F